MAIRTTCPSCRAVYNLADSLAGKTVRCKECQTAIVVRAAKRSAEVDDDESETGRASGTREKIQTRPQPPRRPLVREEEEEEWPRRREREEDRDLRPIRRSNRGLVVGLIACVFGLILMLAGVTLIVVALLPSQSGSPLANGVTEDDEPPNGDAVTRALHQLKSTKLHIRHEGLRKLKDMLPDEGRRGEVIKALEPHLNDSDFFARQWAIEALGVWGNKDAVPLLLNAMRDKDTRRDAMKALGRLKDERAVEPIAARLEEMSDAHPAAEALKAMGPIAEKAVLARLSHPEVLVRWQVCEILEAIGTKQSLPALEKTEANDFAAKIQARKAIAAIRARQ
jgi:predicted Zn finger-like uncharacterized protein